MSATASGWLPDRAALVGELSRAAVVGATLFVLGESLPFATASAGLFLLLKLVTGVTERVVGDYADHALFGALVLAAAGYAAVLTVPWWVPVGGALLGGWLLIDGVQHLRHGVSRDQSGLTTAHDGGVATGIPKALFARLAEPFRL